MFFAGIETGVFFDMVTSLIFDAFRSPENAL